MAVAGRQNLIRDAVELIRTRALRIAATDLGANSISRVWVKNTGETNANVPAGKTWIITELDNTTLTALDEKAFGSHSPHVPDPTRP